MRNLRAVRWLFIALTVVSAGCRTGDDDSAPLEEAVTPGDVSATCHDHGAQGAACRPDQALTLVGCEDGLTRCATCRDLKNISCAEGSVATPVPECPDAGYGECMPRETAGHSSGEVLRPGATCYDPATNFITCGPGNVETAIGCDEGKIRCSACINLKKADCGFGKTKTVVPECGNDAEGDCLK